ncbi:hypothetical protein D3C83_251670 [compost metagenome]
MQHLVHFGGAEKDVLTAILPHQKPEAIGMALHAPTHEIELLGHAERVAPVAHELPVALHGAKTTLERLALVG